MHEITILSDEEFYERQKQKKRKNFLSELEQMTKQSKSSNSFSIKDVKVEDKPKEIKEDDESLSASISKSNSSLDDIEWEGFVADLTEYSLSPIESITDDNISGFRLDPDVVETDDNKYSKVFKKELAMLSEVLKDVKAHGSRMDQVLKKMNIVGKGASSRVTGVPKGYTDLVEAYNSNNTTKIQIIKSMADLKSKQMDWSFKDKANNVGESESVDSIADSYYKKIIGGGTNNFVKNNLNQYQSSDFEYDNLDFGDGIGPIPEEIPNPSAIDSLAISNGFNITQPIKGSRAYIEDDVIGDEFGNIANEKRDYEFVAYQYGDNKYQLGAIDSDGEVVENVELPTDIDPDIVNSLSIRPGSNFVYDKYGRKYRIIEMGSVDISDVDDMDYPY